MSQALFTNSSSVRLKPQSTRLVRLKPDSPYVVVRLKAEHVESGFSRTEAHWSTLR